MNLDFELPKRYGLNKPNFKLMAGQHFAKFDSSLKPLKNLESFVDLSKQMKDLNYIEHKKVRQIMQHMKFQSQNRKLFSVSEQQQQIEAISKQLEMELENLGKQETTNREIDLIKLRFSPQLTSKLLHQSAVTLETHYNLHRIKEKLNKRNITLTENELLTKINQVNFLTARNSDTQEFYRLSNTFHPRKQQQPTLSLDEKFLILKQYLKERGIQIGVKEPIPNGAYMQFYHDTTNKLIKQTREQQMLKFRKSITLKTENDVTPFKRTSITKVGTITGVTPNNGVSYLSAMHSSLTKGNSPILITQPRASVNPTERSPDKPYSEKWQDFVNKAEALQSFYNNDGKDSLQTMEDMETAIEKPYLRHFNQIIKIESEQGNLEDEQKQNKLLRKRKHNLPKKLRMQKIFKSELP